MNCKNLMLLILPLALLVSCSSKQATPITTLDTVLTNINGQFIDAPVEGLNYSSTSVPNGGVTGTNGSFQCALGEEVTFKLGTNLIIGRAACGKKIFLDSLDTSAHKATIGAVLQSIGLNGPVITIPTSLRTASMSGIILDNATSDTDISAYVLAKAPGRKIISKSAAVIHIDTQREANIFFTPALKAAINDLAWYTQADGGPTIGVDAYRYNINEDIHIIKNAGTNCAIDFYFSLYRKTLASVDKYYANIYTSKTPPTGDGQRLTSDVFTTIINITESGANFRGQGSFYLDLENKKLKGKINYSVILASNTKECSATINEIIKDY